MTTRISTGLALLFSCAAVNVWAGAIGGAVTGGTAATEGGTYVQLTVPWGNATTPPNTVGDNSNLNWDLNEFNEVQGLTLTAPLSVGVGGTAGVIPAGTVIDSQYVVFNPPGGGGNLIGDVMFDAPVLGIITSDAGLAATNTLLGVAGITYLDPAAVGLEAGDVVSINSSKPDQIDWDTSASNPGDSVRVITGFVSATATPEPDTFVLLAAGLSVLLFIRYRGKAVSR